MISHQLWNSFGMSKLYQIITHYPDCTGNIWLSMALIWIHMGFFLLRLEVLVLPLLALWSPGFRRFWEVWKCVARFLCADDRQVTFCDNRRLLQEIYRNSLGESKNKEATSSSLHPYLEGFLKWGVPQIHLNGMLHYKASIWYLHSWSNLHHQRQDLLQLDPGAAQAMSGFRWISGDQVLQFYNSPFIVKIRLSMVIHWSSWLRGFPRCHVWYVWYVWCSQIPKMVPSQSFPAAQAAQASPPWPAAQMSNESQHERRLRHWNDGIWMKLGLGESQNHPKSPGKSHNHWGNPIITGSDYGRWSENFKTLIHNQLRPPNPSGLANPGRPGGLDILKNRWVLSLFISVFMT